ncbi:MAG: Spermidine synthase [Myxococcaceae bacterium]|nr:Spermidine synthase [Myxococcaceae bacterium]
MDRSRRPLLLYLTVLVIATAGLVYELLAGALASYVLGDSVTQFSTTIGVYLSALGLGAYLSKYITERLAQRFVEVELAAALLGGSSAPLLFLAFGRAESFSVLLYTTVIAIGTLVGLELPLLMRILREEVAFETLVSRVLTFDYVGALVGSLLFALVLVPKLGLVRTSLLFGALNCSVAIMTTWVLADRIYPPERAKLRIKGALLLVALGACFMMSEQIVGYSEQSLFESNVIYSEQTAYQRIVMTRGGGGQQLFLNGNLQFNSVDEYRYHEALVHPAFFSAKQKANVLVLGGGDGLAVREILKHPEVEHVTLIELDPGMIRLAREAEALRRLNQDALRDPRVKVIVRDALVYLDRELRETFDVVIVDFPDPNNFSLGKLYSTWFYALLAKAMHQDTIVSVQSTSPLFAQKSFWCVVETMQTAGLFTLPYHALVPSFGEWGYVLAKKQPFAPPSHVSLRGLRYLDDESLRALFLFSADMGKLEVEPNRLNNQLLVQYYEQDWARWK